MTVLWKRGCRLSAARQPERAASARAPATGLIIRLLSTTTTTPDSGRHPAKDTYPSCSPPCPTVPGGSGSHNPIPYPSCIAVISVSEAWETISPARTLATSAPAKVRPTPRQPPVRRTSRRGTGGSRHRSRGRRATRRMALPWARSGSHQVDDQPLDPVDAQDAAMAAMTRVAMTKRFIGCLQSPDHDNTRSPGRDQGTRACSTEPTEPLKGSARRPPPPAAGRPSRADRT